MSRAARLFGALLVGAAALPAAAMEFSVTPEAIVASGEIGPDELARFKRFIASVPRRPAQIQLHSPGGKLAEGIALGTFFRESGFATRIARGQSCASACVFAFVGGLIREVDQGGRVGVHMASLARADNYIAQLKKILVSQEVPLDERIRQVVRLNEQTAALAAHLEVSYVIRMGVSYRLLEPIANTEADRMHWLSRQELVDYNVVNVK